MALKHALLALLEDKKMTGYEMKESLDGPLELMWSASFGGIYPALHKMELEKLITQEVIIQTGKPNKIVYGITPKGSKELQAWFHKPPVPESIKDEFLLKMYLLPDADPMTIETLLVERKSRSEQKVAQFETAQAEKKQRKSLFVEYSLNRYLSELRWITDTLHVLKTKPHTK